MRFLDAFRDPAAARPLVQRLHTAAAACAGREGGTTLMEVCGSHTMAIARYGIRDILPASVRLVSGPGCPVCVTPAGYLDAALELAARGITIATFGDMLGVPASTGSLREARAGGAAIEICYSPDDALALALAHPEREVVFLAIGFETTVAPVINLVPRAIAAGAGNLSLLCAFKTIPTAVGVLLGDPAMRIDGLLCPAHVSAIIGADAYEPAVRAYRVPCVIAGFEPLDILMGIEGLLRQVGAGEARVENQYSRVVRPGGNPRARRLIETYLEPADADWRGIGTIPGSGLAIREPFAAFDAARRHGVSTAGGREHPGCRCGDVVRGMLAPTDCPLFGTGCTPEHPVGPCMVSSEGSCAAYLKYALPPR